MIKISVSFKVPVQNTQHYLTARLSLQSPCHFIYPQCFLLLATYADRSAAMSATTGPQNQPNA